MNFGDLQQLVLSWVDDLSAGYFTIPQISRFINNAQLEVQKQLIQSGQNWYQKCVETATVYNQNSYVLPADFLKVDHMTIVTGNAGQGGNEMKHPIFHSTHAEADQVNYTLSCPRTFYLAKNCIVFAPYPDKVYLLRMDYDYLVADMVFQTDTPDIPRQYQEYIAVLASIDCFLKDQRDPSPFFSKKQYYEDMMKKDAQDRMVDRPRMIVETGGGGGFLF